MKVDGESSMQFETLAVHSGAERDETGSGCAAAPLFDEL